MFRKNIVLKSILLSLGGFVVTPFAFAETFDPAIDGFFRHTHQFRCFPDVKFHFATLSFMLAVGQIKTTYSKRAALSSPVSGKLNCGVEQNIRVSNIGKNS